MIGLHGLLGESEAISEVKAFIKRAARIRWSVLIQGETGTGKELVAQALHLSSDRSAAPFVAVDCAALSEELLVSELFGHERGSFTGAFARQKGKFELADGGTLFLDEIGELGLPTQVKLLRALQEHKIDRIGGRYPLWVDVRVIAATNRDLEAGVAQGWFREDLLFRLNSLVVRTPPLRERRDDIPFLARHFLKLYAAEAGKAVTEISPEAERKLRDYDWPGNVRELQNAMQHAVAFADGSVAGPQDLPDLRANARNQPDYASFQKVVYHTKRNMLEEAIVRTDGDYREAALQLGLNPKSMHRYLSSYNLKHLLR